jgi:hypothetical protein
MGLSGKLVKNLFNPQTLIIIGVLLSAIGAFWASQQQAQFERDLRTRSDEISSLNKEIVNLVTGGKSYTYFIFSGTIHNPLTLVQKGKHPLHNAKCRLITLGDYTKLPSRSPFAYFSKNEKRLDLGNLESGAWGLQPKFELTDSPIQGFNVFFEARNGVWEQMIRIRKIDNNFQWATKVIRKLESTEEILYEHTSEKFPLNDKGKIDWYKPE